MKGKYHVIVQNNRIHYEFDIRRNITVIRGDSASGKTTLYQMIDQVTRQGISAGIDIVCEKNCRTLPAADWKLILPRLREQILFIDEDSRFIRTQEFAEAVKASDNYYVLITRENLPNLPYSVDEIYGIHNAGKYHDLRRTYNEFYRIYGSLREESEIRPDTVITEDSNSGYDFYNALCKDGGQRCKSAKGKSNILSVLKAEVSADGTEKEILAVADGAAVGSEMADLYLFSLRWKNIHLYLPESFEWLILKSGLIDGNRVKKILERPENYAESTQYFSWEQLFEAVLIRETQNTYLHYQKKSLNPAYLQKKEMTSIIRVIEGIKFKEK